MDTGGSSCYRKIDTRYSIPRRSQWSLQKPIAVLFSFDALVAKLRSLIQQFPDRRTGLNSFHSIEDAALGAFSLFFTQNPSFLSFQNTMQKAKGKRNALTLFGTVDIPTDKHIRSLLDPVHPSYVFPIFPYIIDGLRASGELDTYRFLDGDLFCSLDGTQIFSSKMIHSSYHGGASVACWRRHQHDP